MKNINFKDEIYNQYWPQIEYLIKNMKDQNKINSNLDIASENIRALETIEEQVQSLIRDFKTCKKLILGKTIDKKDIEK